MKNLHLIPINVIDIVEKMSVPNIRDTEHANYVYRLEAIRDFCEEALKKQSKTQDMFCDQYRRKAKTGKRV